MIKIKDINELLDREIVLCSFPPTKLGYVHINPISLFVPSLGCLVISNALPHWRAAISLTDLKNDELYPEFIKVYYDKK